MTQLEKHFKIKTINKNTYLIVNRKVTITHDDKKNWYVDDIKTGQLIGHGYTKSGALVNAKNTLKMHGVI